jgi:17-hydroxy-3-oxo-4-pregnene-20-carboxyl-CoA lyase
MGRHDVAVIGIGQTEYSRGSRRDEWSLAVEAIGKALSDCGLDPGSVDGLVRFSYDAVDEAMLVRTFGWTLNYYSQTGYGGLGAPAVLAHAAAAIASRHARVVVCYRSLNGHSGTRYGRAERSVGSGGGDRIATGDRAPSGAFAGPYGLLSPGQVMAMWARRYQWEAGIAEGDLVAALARVAVDQRSYASRNPDAVMRDRPLDTDAYLAGRMIATPLRVFDLALETDGAAAIVVAAADVARACFSAPAWITASTAALLPYAESIAVYGELRNGPSYRAIGAELFARAGLRHADLAAALIYDATSISVLLGLEGYGLAEPGAAWRTVLDHGLGLDAPLPVNTCGGHLSEAYVHGMNLVVEAVRQCRGTSPNQSPRGGPVLVSSGPSAAVLEP